MIALNPGTARVLREHHRRDGSAARACGLELRPDAFVFSRRPGGAPPIRPDNATTIFSMLAVAERLFAGLARDVVDRIVRANVLRML